jgi:arginine/lysine/ornithine decarboxylase
MPGERIGVDSSPLVQYLKVLEAFDKNFPGFASETHGVHRAEDGSYQILCVKEQKS